MLFGSGIPSPGQTATAIEPGEGSLDHPTFGQNDECFCLSDRFTISTSTCAMMVFMRCESLALISAVGIKLQKEWIQPKQRGHQHGATIAVLNVGRVYDGLHQQARRIDNDMRFLPLIFFPAS